MSSLNSSTLKQYSSALKPWLLFCVKSDVNPFNPRVRDLLLFLKESWNSGSSYGTLNPQWSAISLISDQKIGEDAPVTRFLKGCFKLKPTKSKYTSTQDINVVLDFLEDLGPSEGLSFQQLSEKIVTIIALISAHRAQTLSKIKISNIRYIGSENEIIITDIIKTSAPGRPQPILRLPECKDRPNLCLAACVNFYVKYTESFRNSEDSLFLSIKNPRKISQYLLRLYLGGSRIHCRRLGQTRMFFQDTPQGTNQHMQPQRRVLIQKSLRSLRAGQKDQGSLLRIITNRYSRITDPLLQFS